MAPDRRAPDDADVLDVFAVSADGGLVTLPPALPDEPGLRELSDDVRRALGDLRAAPGPRLGLRRRGRAVTRTGHAEEIFQPVLADPVEARRRLLTGEPFAGIDGLRIDPQQARTDGDRLEWPVEVQRRPTSRGRAARLSMQPTPSGCLVVLTLVPVRPRRRRTHEFVRTAVPIVAQIEHRLRRAMN